MKKRLVASFFSLIYNQPSITCPTEWKKGSDHDSENSSDRGSFGDSCSANELRRRYAEGTGDRTADAALRRLSLGDYRRPQRQCLCQNRALPDELCNRAASLLDAADPVVQAIGQWTLALRVAKQNKTENWAGRLFKPGPDATHWHSKWQDRSADLALRDDYGRQLVNVNRHRTLDALQEEVERIADRCEAMLARPRSRIASSERERLEDAIVEARQAAIDGDLVHGHRAYLDLRVAVREALIAGKEEFPAEGFVFHAAYSIPGGDNNVNGAVIGRDKPGGEIYIKRSTDPADSAKPLLRGRLGDGSIHGIDLHGHGDRIVFSFWHKPMGDYVLGFDRQNAHLYELDLKSDAIRQLTDDPSDNDIEPCYLPDGGFIFASAMQYAMSSWGRKRGQVPFLWRSNL